MLKTKSISNAKKKKPGCDQMIGNGPVLHKGPKKNILKTQRKNCEGRAQFWQAALFFVLTLSYVGEHQSLLHGGKEDGWGQNLTGLASQL